MTSETKLPHLQWNDRGHPRSTKFDDVYFSETDGLAESRYVFLDGNQLAKKWRALEPNSVFIIGETGFGTGLNFLACWQLWQKTAPDNCRLHFISVEKFPLSNLQLKKALCAWPELKNFIAPLLDQYPPIPATDFRRLVFDEGKVTLTLLFDDAENALTQLLPIDKCGAKVGSKNIALGSSQFKVDAWFLDGFAPAKNPEMWTSEVFKLVSRLSRRGTSFATFTVAGEIRRKLESEGFKLTKLPGFGRKREMLSGELTQPTIPAASPKPDASWHLTEAQNKNNKLLSVAILGAGICGAITANILAKRNIKVYVIERNTIAAGASGNRQGIVYGKLSHANDVLARFNLMALHFAHHYYQRLGFFEKCGEKCGVIYIAQNKRQRETYREIAAKFSDAKNFVKWANAAELSTLANIPLTHEGLYLADSGWLKPKEMCRSLLDHTNINVIENSKIDTIRQSNQRWHMSLKRETLDRETLEQETLSLHTDALVIAAGAEIRNLPLTEHLSVKSIRGQVTHVDASSDSQQLRSVICGNGYIAPESDNQHCIGASFNLHEHTCAIRNEDQQANINAVAELTQMPPLQANCSDRGRVSFRATTPDYLPIVGPVAKPDVFIDRFCRFRTNLKATVDELGAYHPNLYTLTGMGSRGLAYAPLCADLLTNLITGEPIPLPLELYQHLHPARFIVRDIARNRL